MGDVTYLHDLTSAEVPVENVLNGAIAANLDTVIVIGREQNGEYFFASSGVETGELLLMCERFRERILKISTWKW